MITGSLQYYKKPNTPADWPMVQTYSASIWNNYSEIQSYNRLHLPFTFSLFRNRLQTFCGWRMNFRRLLNILVDFPEAVTETVQLKTSGLRQQVHGTLGHALRLKVRRPLLFSMLLNEIYRKVSPCNMYETSPRYHGNRMINRRILVRAHQRMLQPPSLLTTALPRWCTGVVPMGVAEHKLLAFYMKF